MAEGRGELLFFVGLYAIFHVITDLFVGPQLVFNAAMIAYNNTFLRFLVEVGILLSL